MRPDEPPGPSPFPMRHRTLCIWWSCPPSHLPPRDFHQLLSHLGRGGCRLGREHIRAWQKGEDPRGTKPVLVCNVAAERSVQTKTAEPFGRDRVQTPEGEAGRALGKPFCKCECLGLNCVPPKDVEVTLPVDVILFANGVFGNDRRKMRSLLVRAQTQCGWVS